MMVQLDGNSNSFQFLFFFEIDEGNLEAYIGFRIFTLSKYGGIANIGKD